MTSVQASFAMGSHALPQASSFIPGPSAFPPYRGSCGLRPASHWEGVCGLCGPHVALPTRHCLLWPHIPSQAPTDSHTSQGGISRPAVTPGQVEGPCLAGCCPAPPWPCTLHSNTPEGCLLMLGLTRRSIITLSGWYGPWHLKAHQPLLVPEITGSEASASRYLSRCLGIQPVFSAQTAVTRKATLLTHSSSGPPLPDQLPGPGCGSGIGEPTRVVGQLHSHPRPWHLLHLTFTTACLHQHFVPKAEGARGVPSRVGQQAPTLPHQLLPPSAHGCCAKPKRSPGTATASCAGRVLVSPHAKNSLQRCVPRESTWLATSHTLQIPH